MDLLLGTVHEFTIKQEILDTHFILIFFLALSISSPLEIMTEVNFGLAA